MRHPFAVPPRWCVLALAALTLVGVGVRVGYVLTVSQPSRPGYLVDYDPIYYHRQAILVADDRGFIAPYRLDDALRGPATPSAGHPPLLVAVLAAASAAGVDGFTAHRLLTALLGALAVPVIGLLAGWLATWRAGVVAAGLAALAPNRWLYDGLLMPEAPYALLVALALVAAYRWYRTARATWAAALGVLVGLATLTRGEATLLVPVLTLPVALVARAPSRAARVRAGAVAVGATVLVVAPWAAYNLSRFERPVIVSTAMDTTIGGANCRPTYFTSAVGSWTNGCFADIEARREEESVTAAQIRSRAIRYMQHHVPRIPLVVAARLGRVWDVYRPGDNVGIGELQRRPRVWSWIGLGVFAALVPLAVAGGIVLQRRRVPLLPLVAMPVLVSLTAALFYGNPRFRVPAEIAIVVLAAVALDAAGTALGARRAQNDPAPSDPAQNEPVRPNR